MATLTKKDLLEAIEETVKILKENKQNENL
jgi:hypothetical protein